MGRIINALEYANAVIGNLDKPFIIPVEIGLTAYKIRKGEKVDVQLASLEESFNRIQENIERIDGTYSERVERLNELVVQLQRQVEESIHGGVVIEQEVLRILEGVKVGDGRSMDQLKEVQQNYQTIMLPEMFGESLETILSDSDLGVDVAEASASFEEECINLLGVKGGIHVIYRVPIKEFGIALRFLKRGQESDRLAGLPLENSSVVVPERELCKTLESGKRPHARCHVQVKSSHERPYTDPFAAVLNVVPTTPVDAVDIVKEYSYGKAMQTLRDSYKKWEIDYSNASYEIVIAYTYAMDMKELDELLKQGKYPNHPRVVIDGKTYMRPLTFKEVLEVKVNDYETLKDAEGNERTQKERLKLFKTWLDSSTGIAYKANTTKFKLIHQCDELITIDRKFSDYYLSVSYRKLHGNELDSSKDKYGLLLTQKQVLNHPAWLEAVEGDKTLLKNYTKIVFDVLKQQKAMGFMTRTDVTTDDLLALSVSDLNNNSFADGGTNLDYPVRFPLVAQVQVPKAPRQKAKGSVVSEEDYQALQAKFKQLEADHTAYVRGSVSRTEYKEQGRRLRDLERQIEQL